MCGFRLPARWRARTRRLATTSDGLPRVELQPWFKSWWRAVDAVEAGHVVWRYPGTLAEVRHHEPRKRRTGADLLDAVLAELR
jgi:hypothetical protein